MCVQHQRRVADVHLNWTSTLVPEVTRPEQVRPTRLGFWPRSTMTLKFQEKERLSPPRCEAHLEVQPLPPHDAEQYGRRQLDSHGGHSIGSLYSVFREFWIVNTNWILNKSYPFVKEELITGFRKIACGASAFLRSSSRFVGFAAICIENRLAQTFFSVGCHCSCTDLHFRENSFEQPQPSSSFVHHVH